MDEHKTEQASLVAAPLEPSQVFRPGRKGAWHLQAHSEYGVLWSHCGIRAKAAECQRPPEALQIRDLCGTCSRAAKEGIGRAPLAERRAKG